MKPRAFRRGLLVIFAAVTFLFFLAYSICRVDWYLEVSKSGGAQSQLLTLGEGVRIVARDNQFSAADWDSINDMKGLARYLVPRLEQGEHALIDPWGEQYTL